MLRGIFAAIVVAALAGCAINEPAPVEAVMVEPVEAEIIAPSDAPTGSVAGPDTTAEAASAGGGGGWGGVAEEQDCGFGCRVRGMGGIFTASRSTAEIGPRLWASRAFASRGTMAPAEFGGYGIIYFPGNTASASEAGRVAMFCEAFRTLPSVNELETPPESIPRSQQFVTIWPLRGADDVLELREAEAREREALRRGDAAGAEMAEDALCAVAATGYDRNDATRAAQDAGPDAAFSGRGPYLLAWAPGAEKGADSKVLELDLSQVNTSEEAKRDLRLWATLIEGDRAVWGSGFSTARLAFVFRRWIDGTASSVLKLLG